MIRIHAGGQTLELPAPDGGTALDLIMAAGIFLYAPCGGRGICGKCAVRDKDGGVFLACAATPRDGMEIWCGAAGGDARILTGWHEKTFTLSPAVEKRAVTIAPPSLSDNRPDDRRLSDALGGVDIPFELLGKIPRGPVVTAVMQDGKLTGLEEGDTSGSLTGAAFDIGTTTLAGYLADLTDGRILSSASAMNPQRIHGADVCSRMDFAAREDGAETLRREITDAVVRLIGTLCARAGRPEKDIYRVVFAGNTVMLHFLLGLNSKGIATAPFIPVSVRPWRIPAGRLGLSAGEGAIAVTMPCAAAYVGADTVAAVLAAGMDGGDGTSLLIDFGTNGEIVLRHGGRLYACSVAAGPAFEGGNISCGLPGTDDAVGSFSLGGETTGNKPPAGLCGTGLVNVAAELLRAGLMDETGRLLEGDSFAVAPGVTLTQADVRALQCAKAAVAAGVRTLMRAAGIRDVDTLYPAGGFGSYMNAANAAAIGLIPNLPAERIRSLGNAAGAGAVTALLSSAALETAAALEIEYIELSASPVFGEFYTDAMMFDTLSFAEKKEYQKENAASAMR